jgi:hypothetical protein
MGHFRRFFEVSAPSVEVSGDADVDPKLRCDRLVSSLPGQHRVRLRGVVRGSQPPTPGPRCG